MREALPGCNCSETCPYHPIALIEEADKLRAALEAAALYLRMTGVNVDKLEEIIVKAGGKKL